MNLDFIKSALTGVDGITELKACDYATNLDFVGNGAENDKKPAVFYHPWGERSIGEGSLDTGQEMDVSIALRIVAKNIELEGIREQVRAKLQTLLPRDNALSKLQFVEGQVIDVQKSTIWWRDIYSFKTEA